MAKSYNTHTIQKILRRTNAETAQLLADAGFKPVRTISTEHLTFRKWGQDAYDFAVQRRAELDAKNKTKEVARTAASAVGEQTGLPLTNIGSGTTNKAVAKAVTSIQLAALNKLWEAQQETNKKLDRLIELWETPLKQGN